MTSLEKAISLLGENQKRLADQIARSLAPEDIARLTLVLNQKFDSIEDTLASQKASIEALEARVALNPIPTFVDHEVPSGSINSTNATFTLAHTPAVGSLDIVGGATSTTPGSLLRQSVHYLLSGNVVTFQAGSIPATGSYLLASYRYTS